MSKFLIYREASPGNLIVYPLAVVHADDRSAAENIYFSEAGDQAPSNIRAYNGVPNLCEDADEKTPVYGDVPEEDYGVVKLG